MAPKKRTSSNAALSAASKRQRKENTIPGNKPAYSTRAAKASKPINDTDIKNYSFSPNKKTDRIPPIVCYENIVERTAPTGTHASENTPMRASTTHANNPSMRGSTPAEVTKGRKDDARQSVESFLSRDVDGVIDLAAPENKKAKHKADSVAKKIASTLEKRISDGKRKSKVANNDDYQKFASWLNMKPSQKIDTQKERAMYAPISAFVCSVGRLIQESHSGQTRLSSSISAKRLLIPSERTDTNCGDADDDSRIDIGIAAKEVLGPVKPDKHSLASDDVGTQTDGVKASQIWYKDLFAVIEVKCSEAEAEFNNAYAQLFMYTRNIYATQHNRRYAWGLVICGTKVVACKFGPNYVLASKRMDVASAEGRSRFIQFLVYWSYCEDHRLGYDPTMRRIGGLRCWEIKVPTYTEDGNDNITHQMPKIYYSNHMVTVSERLFGRHTRCFLATPNKPSIGKELEYKDYSIFIKDAWPEADMVRKKDHRDEVRHLRTIREKLEPKMPEPGSNSEPHVVSDTTAENNDRMVVEESPSARGMYPRYEAGGRVLIEHADSDEPMEDTTKQILAQIPDKISAAIELGKASPKGKKVKSGKQYAEADKLEQMRHFRVHKRIAMTPIGLPIKELDSIYELLIVVADVMKCHNTIYKRCKILHRDISLNNIMFRRAGDRVTGLLIDFDHAKNEGEQHGVTHDMRTGTLPFMSINNLENNSTDRTTLDDWESLIYILCWIGAYGFNSKTKPTHFPSTPFNIRQWVTDNMQLNAVHKRRDMEDQKQFSQITKQFNKDLPGCDLLTRLVHILRKTLVNSEVEDAPQGTMFIDTTYESLESLIELHKIMQSPTGYDNLTTPTKRPSSKQPALTRGGVSTGAAPIPSVGPAKTTVNTDSDTNDPIAKRVDYASLISGELLEVVEIFSHLAKKAIAAHAA